MIPKLPKLNKLFSKISLLIICYFAIIFILPNLKPQNQLLQPQTNPFGSIPQYPRTITAPLVFASLPAITSQIQTSFQTDDARIEIIRQYLDRYKSPLRPYAKLIVQLSDKYNFDYRWLVAIAQQESSLCKRIPPDSYNCWGWGIYGDKVTKFNNYQDALISIAPQFKEIFLQDAHLKDPYEVMQTYTPPSDGSWAEGVLYFFKQLE